MGSPSVASWTSAIKAVEKLVEGPAADPPAYAVQRVVDSFVTLFNGPPLPHAAVKKLVFDIKAPKAAAMLCMRALQRHPRSTALLDATTSLLEAVLKCSRRRPGRAPAHDTRVDASTLQQLQQAGLVQQLPALMAAAAEGLAAASKAAAEAAEMRIRTEHSSSSGGGSSADADESATQCSDAALVAAFSMQGVACSCAESALYVCLHVFNCSASDADTAAFCHQAAPAAVQLILAIFEASSRLSLVQQQARPPGPEAAPAEGCGQQPAAGVQQHQPLWSLLVRQCWGDDDLREAMALSFTLFLKMGMCLSCLKTLETPGASTAGTARPQGAGRVTCAAPPAGPTSTLEPNAFLCSPELQRCLDLMSLVTLTAAAAMTSSSSSTSSTASRVSETASRQRAQGVPGLKAAVGAPDMMQVGGTQPPGRPLSDPCIAATGSWTSQLCRLLGVSRATVLQAADFCSIGDADDAVDFLRVLAMLHTRLCPPGLARFCAEQSPKAAQQGLVEAERSLLLFVQMLQWMDSLPSSHTDRLTEGACYAVASTACQLCGLALRVVNRAGGGVSQVLLPADGAVPADEGQTDGAPKQQQQQGVRGEHGDKPLMQGPLVPPTSILAELVPLIVRLSQSRLQLLQRTCPPDGAPGASSTTAGTVGGAADAATTAQSPQAAACQQGAADCDLRVCIQLTALCCVLLLEQLVLCASSKPDAASASTATGAAKACSTLPVAATGPAFSAHSVLHSQEVFARHACDIVSCFEAGVRMCMHEPDSILQPFLGVENTLERVDAALALVRAAGLAPDVMRQTYSLLSTLQRSLNMQDRVCDSSAQSSTEMLMTACLRGTEGAAALLNEANQQQLQPPQDPQAGLCMASVAASLSLLPSLVIIGRCFLQLATMLQPAVAPDSLAEQQQQQQRRQQQQQHVLDLVPSSQQLAVLAATAQQWLQAHSQLLAASAAGYGPDRVLQQLEQLLAALGAITASGSSAVVQQLQLAGTALSSLPVPCLCNHPGCTNAAGLSELGLVSGRSCVCGGCRVAHYCGRSCQRSHWKQHKPVCAALAKAAAVAGGAAAR